MDFAVPTDLKINLKEGGKRIKYLDLARDLKKLRNIKVTMIPSVIGVLDTVTTGLVKGLEDLKIRGRVGTIQISALARILKRVLETWGDLLLLRLQWKNMTKN